MAHYTTGLPKLDLEPFDPTALYAAANTPGRDKDLRRTRRSQRGRRPFAVVGAAASVIAALGAALYYFVA